MTVNGEEQLIDKLQKYNHFNKILIKHLSILFVKPEQNTSILGSTLFQGTSTQTKQINKTNK